MVHSRQPQGVVAWEVRQEEAAGSLDCRIVQLLEAEGSCLTEGSKVTACEWRMGRLVVHRTIVDMSCHKGRQHSLLVHLSSVS